MSCHVKSAGSCKRAFTVLKRQRAIELTAIQTVWTTHLLAARVQPLAAAAPCRLDAHSCSMCCNEAQAVAPPPHRCLHGIHVSWTLYAYKSSYLWVYEATVLLIMRLHNANSTCTVVAAARSRRKERLAAAARRRACIVTATRSCLAVSLRMQQHGLRTRHVS